jgi:signal transduction histidine kinase
LELERSNADLAEFANAASHDLKAPLRGISHLAHWVADDVASGKVGAESLENCALLASRADRMQRLLDGLLAFAKVGRGEMQPDSVDTAEMIRDLVPGLALPPGFSVVVDGAMPVISTLRLHLEVIFQNLIENAVKHHDRASGRVTISAVTQERWVCFTVTDDGPGIAPRNHARIFRMFQTLARHDSSGSTGIGLAIVKKKVTMLGGTIEVHSNPPERGTSFVFTWPRQTGPTQMWRHPAAPGKPRQSEIAT